MKPTLENVIEGKEVLVEEIQDLLSMGRKIALAVAYKLWSFRNQFYPENKDHAEFVQYCIQEFGIKQAAISKYEGIGDGFYAHGLTPESFIVDGKYKDYEVVYYASKLPLPLEEKLSNALTLSRTETKQTKAELDKHVPDFKEVCVVKDCWLTKENHP